MIETNLNRYRDPALRGIVKAAKFLTVDNAARHRIIIRYFCDQMEERQRDWLAADEVLAVVRAAYDPEYSESQCDGDLAQLCEWGNLLAEQDRGRARTVEEFKRRRLLYHVTERTVALDRLTRVLDGGEAGRGRLDASLLERLWSRLDALRHTLENELPENPNEEFLRQEVWAPWDDAFRLFEQLRTGANDFHHALRAARPQDLNRVEEFLAYKDVLLRNLDAFILQLSAHASRLHHLFLRLEEHGSTLVLVSLLTLYRAEYLVEAGGVRQPEALREQFGRQIAAISEWLLPGCGADVLKDTTRGAIRMVVRHNQRIADRHRIGASRARDLERLARAFAACPDAADAHRLAARSLGCALSRHLQGSPDVHEMTVGATIWAQPPQEVPLRRIRRGRRKGLGAGAAVRDSRAEQARLIEAQMQREQAEAATWRKLFARGGVDLGDLRLDDPAVRDRLMSVLGECLSAADATAIGPDGTPVRLVFAEGADAPGELTAPDGVVVGPRAVLTRVTESVP